MAGSCEPVHEPSGFLISSENISLSRRLCTMEYPHIQAVSAEQSDTHNIT